MKKTIIFLTIILFNNLNLTYSQTAKVTSEDVSQTQLEKQKILDTWTKKSQEYLKLRASLNLPDGNRKFPFQNFDSITQIERALKESEEILRNIQLNPKLWLLAKEIDELANKIGKNSNYYSKLNAQVKIAEENVQNGKSRLNQIDNIEQDKQQHDKQILDLDNELQGLKKQSNDIDKELATHQTKTKNIDDFLASNNNTKNNNVDFLAQETKTSSNNNDFLSESSSTNDFIASQSKKEDYKIDYKDGKQGVVSETGKLLIPYKNWKIVEYKSGIAKAKIDLDSYSCTGSSLIAYKVGFVDVNGDFLDGFDINFESNSGGRVYPKLTLIKANTNDEYWNTREQIRLREEREKRELKIKRQKCDNEIKEWKLQILRQYQR